MELHIRMGQLMEQHGFTNQSMAEASGVPVGTVSGIRSGKIRSPGYDAICAMLSAMGESASALTEAEVVPEAEPPPNENQTIMRQAVQIASLSATLSATLDAHDESAERYAGRCAKLEAELKQERRKNARLQNALVITLVVIVVLMVVFIWDVSSLHNGMTAFFNK